ncbi:hypothetical protein BLA60_17570 [Actinophytocola xinjiangensis]|uniref:HTH cro/C1-type domain-containing protein n=1 Tax=Actinophytocola xinjiangensis TaxID=485602 RepID=A0A7Z0WLJ6_9PSEU|nr:helix-turn-helix transcriptional regulator [Actinophytocola xinjiangensis]OLF10243.1 hypothetical protein BLA60_17570 [Actinophytocola xinjiangensis]
MRKRPQARDRIIGARLRAIRTERVGLSQEQAADLAQWPPARLSRTERGLRAVTNEEVATLLTAWKLPLADRERLLQEMRVGASSGWWDRPLPGVPQEVGALASYESEAHELVSVSLTVIPGLLQTYETAVGVFRADGGPSEDFETGWMARLRRQQILGKVTYMAYISETALRTPYGGSRDAVRNQLGHLLAAQDRGITVRVIPAHQTRVTTFHPFILMRFPHADPVVHVEVTGGAFYVSDDAVVPFASIVTRLGRLALSQRETRTIILRLMEGL